VESEVGLKSRKKGDELIARWQKQDMKVLEKQKNGSGEE